MKKKWRSIKETTEADLNFSSVVDPLVKWIKKKWNWRGLKPRGFKKYLEGYEDYQDMEGISIEDFTGVVNDNTMSPSFPEATSLPNIAYDHTNQGRDPLCMLIYSSVTYGMCVQLRRQELVVTKVMEKRNKELADTIKELEAQLEKLPQQYRGSFANVECSLRFLKLSTYELKS